MEIRVMKLPIFVASYPATAGEIDVREYSDWLLSYLASRPFQTAARRDGSWLYVGLLSPSHSLTKNRAGIWCVRRLSHRRFGDIERTWGSVTSRAGRLVERIGKDAASLEVAADRYADLGGHWKAVGPAKSPHGWTWVPA